MPKLTVVTDDVAHEVPFTIGSSLRKALDAAGIPVRSGCLGNGACGLCRVQIDGGNVSGPTRNEQLVIAKEELNKNIRLACQVTPENGLRVRILDSDSTSTWRDLPREHIHRFEIESLNCSGSTSAGYGLAVDLGTTNISLTLWSLGQNNRLNARMGPNPQSWYGTDVVTRLTAAAQSPVAARKLASLPIEALHKAIRDMCKLINIIPEKIIRLCIVGNTAMMALLMETDTRIMLEPRSWMQPVDLRPDKPQKWATLMGINPHATIEFISPFAGFVGSDLLAGVLASGLTRSANGLLIDFGTNSEIALWDGGTLWVTSAAGGPAFEGCGIRCGMPAEAGAIYRIDWRGPSDLDFHVVGGGEARGLCGSGLIDLVACLRSSGDLTLTGKFSDCDAGNGYVVHLNSSTIYLTKRDVDMLQRAKSAIGVGIETLLNTAGMGARELSRVCVCGAFGRHLNTVNAQQIGLLPNIQPELIELCGNAALAGCEQLLLSSSAKEDLESTRERAVIVNLSQTSDFETLFMDNLHLRPLGG